nr:homocysteine S-methyltransferase family protein [Cereibacter changlensis]
MILLDGGMGRELERSGAPFRQPEWSALALIEAPEAVARVHEGFIRAGAQVITTNSYALVPFHIGEARFAAEGERLAAFAATGATLAIHLSVHVLETVVAELTPHYGADCPVAVVWRASWPDERVVRATLGSLATEVGAEMERTALILVGRALGQEGFDESRLYAGDYDRRYRPVGTAPRFPESA